MPVQPKSPEKMQAQVGEFVRTGGLDYDQREALGQDMGKVALGNLQDYHGTVRKSTWKRTDEGLEQEYVDKPVKIPVEDYVEFLRQGGKELSRRTDFVAEMYQAYDEYRPIIHDLVADIDDYDSPKDHPAFLGSGSNASTFTFKHKGRSLVARVPRGNEARPGLAYDDAVAFERGNNIPNLQHLVAASPETGIIITELLPGKNLEDMTYEELLAIPKKHLGELIELAFKAHDHGLSLDPKSSNYIYDPATGFSLLDYGRLDSSSVAPRDKYLAALSAVRSVVDGKGSALAYNRDEPHDSEHSQAHSLEVHLNGMRLQKRLLEVLQTSYPEILQAAAEHQREMDADPNRFGDAFQVGVKYMPIEKSKELREYREQLLSLGIASIR